MELLSRPQFEAWCEGEGLLLDASALRFAAAPGAGFTIVFERFSFPRVLALAESLIPDWNEAPFSGGVIRFGHRAPWGRYVERVGDTALDLVEKGLGRESVPTSAIRLFGRDEYLAMQVHLLLPMMFGWDATLVPSGLRYFVELTHDGVACITSATVEESEILQARLSDWR